MTSTLLYALDSNIFMHAARAFYAFDIAPGFWASLSEALHQGKIHSIDKVKHEIERGKDELADWIKTDFADGFVTTDMENTVVAYAEIMQWAYSQTQYTDAAKSQFAGADHADAWLVSHALACNRADTSKKVVLVTQETFNPTIKREIKIPNVCKNFGVEYINMYELLRALEVKLS